MAGSSFNREDYKTAIPQLSAQMKEILDNNIVINRTVINLTEGKVSDLNSYLGYFQSLTTGYFQAIAGDIQYLTSREAYINHLKADIAGFGYLTAETADLRYATIQSLTAATARIGDLEADHVSVADLSAATGRISDLEADHVSVAELNAAKGRISDLEADHVSVSDLNATNADVSHLKVGDLTIGGVTVNIYDLAMAIKSDAMASGTTWYKVSATTPSAPTGFDPTSEGWSQTEPAYVAGTTSHLYSCLRVVYADDDPQGTRSYQWSDVHLIQSWEAAKSAYTYANDANTAATTAKSAADNAMKGLGQVEDVVGVLEWITNHGTMESQQGETFDENNVYFVVDPNGDYVIGGTHYSLVTNPVAEDIDSYYCLSVDRSIQNYVATHIVVDSEGLWIIPDSGENKVLIATGGAGKTYETAGMYIIGKDGNDDVTLAQFAINGNQIGRDNETHADIDYHSMQLVDKEGDTYFHVSDLRNQEGHAVITNSYIGDGVTTQFTTQMTATEYRKVTIDGVEQTLYSDYTAHGNVVTFTNAPTNDSEIEITYIVTNETAKAYTFGTRANNSNVGGMSVASGNNVTAEGWCSHAEGFKTVARGSSSHAEGVMTLAHGGVSHAEGESSQAYGYYSHAEGFKTVADGNYSHAQNNHTIAGYEAQTAIGKYNDNQQKNAFEIGNGTHNNRSNAFEVDWSGNVNASGDIEDGQANVLSDKADISSLAAVATSGRYDDLANKPLIPSIGIGSMMMYAGTSAPDGWLMCNGQAVSRTQYARLFDVIGTTYGSGDGSTTFNLPDLRDRFPVGTGSSYALNAKGGANTVTLGIDEMPAHTHDIHYVYYNRGSGSSQTFGYLSTSGPNLGLAESRGGGKAHENRPPYIALNFIIYAG